MYIDMNINKYKTMRESKLYHLPYRVYIRGIIKHTCARFFWNRTHAVYVIGVN